MTIQLLIFVCLFGELPLDPCLLAGITGVFDSVFYYIV